MGSGDGPTFPDHASEHSLFLYEPTSPFQFLGNLCLYLFFCLSIFLFKSLLMRMSKKMKEMKPKAAKWLHSLGKKEICRAKVGFLKENVV